MELVEGRAGLAETNHSASLEQTRASMQEGVQGQLALLGDQKRVLDTALRQHREEQASGESRHNASVQRTATSVRDHSQGQLNMLQQQKVALSVPCTHVSSA